MQTLGKLILYFILAVLVGAQSFSQFSLPHEITNSNSRTDGASCVNVADLDSDGDLDVIGGSISQDKIAWYENLGNDKFSSQKVISLNADYPVGIQGEDLDSDGDVDIISASSQDGQIMWYENLGGGNFSEIEISAAGGSMKGMYVTDLDGDADKDIISISGGGGSMVAWVENLGGGNFAALEVISTAIIWGIDVFASDLDNDGDQDILSASSNDNKIAWYENFGSGNFGAQNVITTDAIGAQSVYSADIDQDGDLDVVSGSVNDSKVAWYENLGTGLFGPQQVIAILSGGVQDVYVNDIDGDLDVDIVAGSYETKIVWYENLGSGVFGTEVVITLEVDKTLSIVVADLNEDNFPEVISASKDDDKTAWYKNEMMGNFGQQILISIQQLNPWYAEAADIDNDGDLDVIASSEDDYKVCWYEQLSPGEYSYQKIISDSVVEARGLSAADLDLDGNIDIVAASLMSDELLWFKNMGSGSFAGAVQITNVPNGPEHVLCADLNGDGLPDILCGSSFDHNAGWVENLGSGIFGTYQLLGTFGSYSICVADFDMDGDNDVLSGESSIKLYENQGFGTFTSTVLLTAPYVISINATDLDLDGMSDILYSADSKIYWKKNNGGLTFSPPILISDFMVYPDLESIDVDVDGDKDIVSSSLMSETCMWYENIGNVVFGSPQLISNTHPGRSIFPFDPDEDGDQDILFANYELNSNIGWFENYLFSHTQVSGKIFIDINQNMVLDSLDLGCNQVAILSNPTSDYVYTFSDGDYFMNFSDSVGTYLLTPENIPYWSVVTDSLSYTVFIDSSFTIIDSLNFGIYPDSIFNQLNSQLVGGFPQCNDQNNYWLYFSNEGTSIPSGYFVLQLDDSIDFVSSEILPDSISGQNIYWHYDSLFYFDDNILNVQVSLPDFNSMGDTLTSYLQVGVLDSNGLLVYTSSDTLNQILVCAYDPNDKISDPSGIDSLGYIPINTPNLEYTIRFQNTGTDTAHNVVIKDVLDSDLNWESFLPLASSHPVQIYFDQNGEITFTFSNIMLPDSNVNEQKSHGFIKYRIELDPGLVGGTTINNTASIFFDSNPAVITNTTTNTLYDCGSILESLIMSSTSCEGVPIFGELTVVPIDSMAEWNLGNFQIIEGDDFYFDADTSGNLNLTIKATTNFCASDTTIQLTIIPEIPEQILQPIDVCNGDSVFVFSNYISVAGFYSQTFQSVNGCDSIVIQEVVFLPVPATTSLPDLNICDGDSTLIFGNYCSLEETYVESLQALNGCDSVVAQSLFLWNSPVQYLSTIQICAGDSVLLFDEYRSVTGLFYDTLQTVNGCDSLLIQPLFVTPDPAITDEGIIQLCSGESVLIFGFPQEDQGIYYDTLLTINGCDSILSVQLDLLPLPVVNFSPIDENSICVQSPSIVLEASPVGGYFTGPGVTADLFDPVISGVGIHWLYYAYSDVNGCVALDSINVTVDDCLSVTEINSQVISTYPNPFNEYTTIYFDRKLDNKYQFIFLDALGRVVYFRTSIEEDKLIIQRGPISNGVYYLNVIEQSTGEIVYCSKLVVE